MLDGDEEEVYRIQCDIVHQYNRKVDLLDPKYALLEEHVRKIKIKAIKKVNRGTIQILLEFVDPCDMITKINYYLETDILVNHTFTEPIPNPYTWEIAKKRI